ncbi:MAG: N-formylglutamate deformylase [Alphaproteobacteria bacterium]|nr:N-formylglutamate deformylase [Alphaproteobacteria bacterium]
MELFRFTPGSTPLLVSMPHPGTYLPDGVAEHLTDEARLVPDTDWHLERLYDFAAALGAGVLAATHSRYLVDLNRPPDNRPLYPGAANTGLCPTELFDGGPLYLPGQEPDAAEVGARLERYWRPYHERLEAELAALKESFGVAVLFEAHSIRSRLPRYFEGRLPDLNLGSAAGASAAPELEARLFSLCAGASGYSSVLNGRFTGGYTTRHYGRPADAVHALQLELAQTTYMDETPPFAFDEARAAHLRPLLRALLEEARDWALGD